MNTQTYSKPPHMAKPPMPKLNAPRPKVGASDKSALGAITSPSDPSAVSPSAPAVINFAHRLGPDFVNPLSNNIGAFVMELAAKLQPVEDILKKYKVTAGQLGLLLRNNAFRDLVREAERDFASITNTAERIRIKAMLLTELGLDEMYLILTDNKVMPNARVSAFAQIKNLTGLEKPELDRGRAQFKLVINVPQPLSSGGQQTITVEGAVDPEDEDEEGLEDEEYEDDLEDDGNIDPDDESKELLLSPDIRAAFNERLRNLGVGETQKFNIIGAANKFSELDAVEE